jgi:antitoxin HicB
MYSYPVTLERDDNGSILVGFPDLPWVHSFGDDEADALAHASDALESALVAIIGEREAVPAPSKIARGRKRVALPALSAAKVAVYAAMREAGLRKAELARRLGWHVPQVDRLLDLRHASRVDQIEAALAALGKRLVIAVRDAA